MKQIYLDHNATTPVDPKVAEAIAPYLGETFGNPSSIHRAGQRARAGLEHAREQVAAMLNAHPDEIIFTSGGTEAANMVLWGVVHAAKKQGIENPHLIASAIEHSCVLTMLELLEAEGCDVTLLPVNRDGIIELPVLQETLQRDTLLVSIMTANNEIGTLQPMTEISKMAHDAGAFIHTDAVQAAAKIPLDVHAMDVDFLSISGHKMYALKGAGALYAVKHTAMDTFHAGGGQENGRRGGTENLVGAVALGKAAELSGEYLAAMPRITALRDRLEKGIQERVDRCFVNGAPEGRVGNTSNFTFHGAEGEAMLMALDLQGIAVSTGSACSSGALDPSGVLTALGLTKEDNKSSLRISLGVGTTEAEIDEVLETLPRVVEEIRNISE